MRRKNQPRPFVLPLNPLESSWHRAPYVYDHVVAFKSRRRTTNTGGKCEEGRRGKERRVSGRGKALRAHLLVSVDRKILDQLKEDKAAKSHEAEEVTKKNKGSRLRRSFETMRDREVPCRPLFSTLFSRTKFLVKRTTEQNRGCRSM